MRLWCTHTNSFSQDRALKVTTLKESYNSWAEWKHIAKEAIHAEKVLSAMLRNISVLEPHLTSASGSSKPPASPVDIQTYEVVPGILGDTLQDPAKISDDDLLPLINSWPFDNFFSDVENFDWVSKPSIWNG